MSNPTPGTRSIVPGLPTLAVVCGLPATGKSTLAARLQTTLGWPLFAKDDLKELLFDVAGYAPESFTRDESRVIGSQAIAVLFRVAGQVLAAGQSCIVESNFLPQYAAADFGPLARLANIRQVHCTIPDDLVLARYIARAEAGERHPVHTDVEAGAELMARIESGGGHPLPLQAPLLQVHTTDGLRPSLGHIVGFLRD